MSGSNLSLDEDSSVSEHHKDFDPRILPVIRIERTLLMARYFGLFLLAVCFAYALLPVSQSLLILISTMVLIFNAITHTILFTAFYSLFMHPAYLCLHLIFTCILVVVSGAEFSPLIVLYPMLIIGYGLYAHRIRQVYVVAFICCAAHVSSVVLYRNYMDVDMHYPAVLMECLGIFMCGWLMEALSRQLQQLETVAQDRARALGASEMTLRTILNNADSPILVYNEDECITNVNDRACEFLGASRTDLQGRRFRSFLFDDGTLPNKWASLRSRGHYQGEFLVITNDGEERTVEMRVQSFVKDHKRYFVSIMHDITKQKRIEEATQYANRQMERANAELQHLNRIRTVFFTTISKRLRSPLTAIKGFIELLQGEELGELKEPQKKALDAAHRSVSRAFGLVDETVALNVVDAESLDKLLETGVDPLDSNLADTSQSSSTIGQDEASESQTP